MICDAILDERGTYRYQLTRQWDTLAPRRCCFIMLNPSTADAKVDDPTIRRCIRFAKDWGFGAMVVVNLFAYRSTDPAALRLVADPVGPGNDFYIAHAIDHTEVVVAAWGNGGMIFGRDKVVIERFGAKMQCFGRTAAGHPKHPLYVPAAANLEPLLMGGNR